VRKLTEIKNRTKITKRASLNFDISGKYKLSNELENMHSESVNPAEMAMHADVSVIHTEFPVVALLIVVHAQ